MEPNQAGAESRSGVSTRAVEIAVAILVFLLGALVIQGSWSLGSGWTTDGPGSGYFPFYIGVLLCVSGLGTLAQSIFGKQRLDDSIFVDREQIGRVLSVLVPAAVYVLAVQFVGIYVASAIYIALFMIVLGKFSVIKSILVGLVVVVLFFFMFEVWFKVPLFKGTLDPLRFLGY